MSKHFILREERSRITGKILILTIFIVETVISGSLVQTLIAPPINMVRKLIIGRDAGKAKQRGQIFLICSNSGYH